jgi:hypothetical protein
VFARLLKVFAIEKVAVDRTNFIPGDYVGLGLKDDFKREIGNVFDNLEDDTEYKCSYYFSGKEEFQYTIFSKWGTKSDGEYQNDMWNVVYDGLSDESWLTSGQKVFCFFITYNIHLVVLLYYYYNSCISNIHLVVDSDMEGTYFFSN